MSVIGGILVAALLGACEEPTGPRQRYTAEVIEPVSSRMQVVEPGGKVNELPSVRVYRSGDNSPIPGVPVEFTLKSPDGVSSTIRVPTGMDGIARLPKWDLLAGPGVYSATVRIEAGEKIVFRAAIVGKIVAIYDLQSLDYLPLPIYGRYR